MQTATIMLAAATLTAAAHADVYLGAGGSGWGSVSGPWGAKVRNVSNNNGDWEVNVGPAPGSLGRIGQAVWNASGVENTFSILRDARENLVQFTWNGSTTSFRAAPGAVNSLAIQLVGRNGDDNVLLSVHNLRLNGLAVVDNPFAAFLSAGTQDPDGPAAWAQLGGSTFSDTKWLLTGSVTATWTGKRPSRDHTRVEFIASPTQLAPPLIPTPAAATALAAAGMLVMNRRRRG